MRGAITRSIIFTWPWNYPIAQGLAVAGFAGVRPGTPARERLTHASLVERTNGVEPWDTEAAWNKEAAWAQSETLVPAAKTIAAIVAITLSGWWPNFFFEAQPAYAADLTAAMPADASLLDPLPLLPIAALAAFLERGGGRSAPVRAAESHADVPGARYYSAEEDLPSAESLDASGLVCYPSWGAGYDERDSWICLPTQARS